MDDRSRKVGGQQCIRTIDGYVIPLDIINGLPYMKMCPNTDHEWNTLPHVILTSSEEWNTTVLDHTQSDRVDWYNDIKQDDDVLVHPNFDDTGRYMQRQNGIR